MSATEEREIEIVAGTIGGITQKKADTWTVQVTPEGSNYAKNLWTKDADLVVALGAKLGEHGAFVGSLGPEYTVSTPEGEKKVRSWWIDSVSDGTENVPEKPADPGRPASEATGSVATPAAAPIAGASKDRLIVRQTCLKAAAELGKSIGEGKNHDTPEQVMEYAAKFERWVTLGILEPIPFD